MYNISEGGDPDENLLRDTGFCSAAVFPARFYIALHEIKPWKFLKTPKIIGYQGRIIADQLNLSRKKAQKKFYTYILSTSK